MILMGLLKPSNFYYSGLADAIDAYRKRWKTHQEEQSRTVKKPETLAPEAKPAPTPKIAQAPKDQNRELLKWLDAQALEIERKIDDLDALDQLAMDIQRRNDLALNRAALVWEMRRVRELMLQDEMLLLLLAD